MDATLTTLFGSVSRVKILRFLLSHQEECVTLEDVASHTKVAKPTVRKEVNALVKLGLMKKQKCIREVTTGRGKKKKEIRKQVPGFIVDQDFEHLYPLRNFILNIAPTDDEGVLKKVKSAGKVKLLIVSGVFIQDPDSRVDVLVVGDAMKDVKLKTAIRDLESHIGRELRYAAFSTKDFLYRISVYDRLVRDVLDYPHQVVVNRLGQSWKDVNMQKR